MSIASQPVNLSVALSAPSDGFVDRSSDHALRAHLLIEPSQSRAFFKAEGVGIIFQDRERAAALACQAEHAVEVTGDFISAIKLFEHAIFFEQGAGLDGDWLAKRGLLFAELGDTKASDAIELYNIGQGLRQLERWQDAEAVYDAAARLDNDFLWPANNVAWQLATAKAPSAHNAKKAVIVAEWVCAKSGWGYWAFLGTLAAAFARCGDFNRAVAWQKISLGLTPEDHRLRAEQELCEFECRRPFTETAWAPAAGGKVTTEEVGELNAQALLQRANEIIIGSRHLIQ